jgi:hypothetical protein
MGRQLPLISCAACLVCCELNTLTGGGEFEVWVERAAGSVGLTNKEERCVIERAISNDSVDLCRLHPRLPIMRVGLLEWAGTVASSSFLDFELSLIPLIVRADRY